MLLKFEYYYFLTFMQRYIYGTGTFIVVYTHYKTYHTTYSGRKYPGKSVLIFDLLCTFVQNHILKVEQDHLLII